MEYKQLHFEGFELADYEREAIDFLKANEPKEGYYVGLLAGGMRILC